MSVNSSETSLVHRGWFQLLLLGVSIAIAIELTRIPFVFDMQSMGLFAQVFIVFAIGVMYSSVLTVAPATIGLIRLAESGTPILFIALIGGVGAMLGDLTLFKIIKIDFVNRMTDWLKRQSNGTYKELLASRFFRFLLTTLGVIIIATPIPDEIGLALMGLGESNVKFVAVFGFIFNALGILAIVTLAR
jgi:hypothetical protein